jgi:uncharacterized membrane protein
MTPPTEELSWFGGGLLAGRTPGANEMILAAGLLIGLAIVAISYRFILVAIAPSHRIVLCLLRFALWLTLFFILAAPTRIERTYDRPASTRSLAVLIDRSGSMTAADNRQQRRLDDALLQWHRLEPAALKTFGPVKAFAFAQGMTPVRAPTDSAALPDGRTDLFASLQDALARAPAGGWGGIVALTDGLDTSGVEAAEALRATARAALTAGTPLFFVIGRNRAIAPPFFHLRELNVPSQTTPHSLIRIEAIFESYQTTSSNLPVEFKVGGKVHPATSLRLEAGRHLATWSAESPAESPGTIEFELRVGTEVARAEVRVEAPSSKRVLYHQGRLDWGYRLLTDILKRNDAFSFTPVFDFPNAGAVLPPGALPRMPLSVQDLQPFGIIVLANVAAQQIQPAQQAALAAWVNDGGILLFLASDDDMTRGFAGSELEKILPVTFVHTGNNFETPTDSPRAAVSVPLPQDRRSGSSHAPSKPANLVSFTWEMTTRVREIFAQTPEGGLADETPHFSAFAHVAAAKPGAEVLARHPTENGPDGRGAILLAAQSYGRGKSVILATDTLWRWKLSQSSKARGVELFWGNLLAWLMRDRDPGFYFDHPPFRSPVNRDVSLRVAGAGTKPLQVEASLDNRRIALKELPAENGSRLFLWNPPSVGLWQVSARDDDGHGARTWLTAEQPQKPSELFGGPPNEDLLRSLAAQTSGAVLNDVPPAWRQEPAPAQLLTERRQPLWHRPWIFGLLLGLYGLELFLRRKWKLL